MSCYRISHRLWITGVLVLLVVSVMPCVASLTAQTDDWLPAPTGPYQVGVTSLTLVDEMREEVYTKDDGDSRAVTIWIWYPADVAGDATPSPYLLDGYDVELSPFAVDVEDNGGDATATREWLAVRLRHAFREAPVSTGQATYPVIVYTTVAPISQSLQFEELASHGYVVVNAVGVTGYSFLDLGSMVKIGDRTLPWEEFLFDLLFKDYLFVLDQLEALNSGDIDSLVAGRLNLDQIGAAGFSYGGWVVMEAALLDNRIKAGITQDYESESAMDRPFLFMRTGATCPRFDVTGPAHFMRIEGTQHTNYSDFALFPRPEGSAPDRIGPIDAARGAEIINAYVVAFFDQYLKGEEQPLLRGPSADYPEVEIVSRNVPEEVIKPPLVISPQDGEIVIDDFESGTLDGWSLGCLGWGSWYVYDDGTTPPNPAHSDPRVPFSVADPPQGEFAAVTDMAGVGTLLLYRDLTLDGTYTLHLNVFYENPARAFFVPDTLAYNLVNNQQLRIDLVDPAAPVDSVTGDDVLATIFRTSPGDLAHLDPTEITFDLSPWDGQTVRLRIANVNNRNALRSGVDNIWVELIE